jgi:hypothetical protein
MNKLEEQEHQLLLDAIDKTVEIKNKYKLDNNVKKIVTIVEDFLKKTKLICYGGTAINNILPQHLQFYNKDTEIPDYDFYSTDALHHAKELANIYFEKGYTEVRAAAGVHYGTFKVFVNFIPIADITQINTTLFNNIKKDSIKKKNIFYAPPNLLRMSMYLELSRPKGDTSRWEKVFNRLKLLNKVHPLKKQSTPILFKSSNNTVINKLKQLFIKEKVIFFGSMAINAYSDQKKSVGSLNILSNDPKHLTIKCVKLLQNYNIELKKKPHTDDILSSVYEIYVNNELVVSIYKTLACYSFVKYKKMQIASIDTMLSLYLLFYYLDYDKENMINIANYLYTIQHYKKNKTKKSGIFKRFSTDCYGKQLTLEQIRAEKSKQYEKLKTQKNTKEYERWFLNYNPDKKLEELKSAISVENGSITPKNLTKAIKILKQYKAKKSLKKTTKNNINKLFTVMETNKKKSVTQNPSLVESWILPK